MPLPFRTPRPLAHDQSFAASAARFASSVAARFGDGIASAERASHEASRTSRVFQRLSSVVVSFGDRHLHVAPRIDVRVASLGRRDELGRDSTARVFAPPRRDHPRTVSADVVEPLVERSRARAVRDEGQSSGEWKRATRAHQRSAAPAGVTPVVGSVAPGTIPRVLRRRAAAPVDAPPASDRGEWSARAAASPARAAHLTPVELGRLTDQIVHTIDRRIAAFRERQGRV